MKYTGGCVYLRHDFPMHHGSYNGFHTPGNPRCRVRPSRWCTPVLQLWSVWHRLWSWWCTWPGGKPAVNKRSQLPISQPLRRKVVGGRRKGGGGGGTQVGLALKGGQLIIWMACSSQVIECHAGDFRLIAAAQECMAFSWNRLRLWPDSSALYS